MAADQSVVQLATEFLRRLRYGVLSTISQEVAGYPFGSIAPYVLDGDGNLIIYISNLAEHTKNIQANPRVSMTLFDPADANDPQAGPRLTWLADALPCSDRDTTDGEGALGSARYLRYFPAARAYRNTHDFAFYRLRPKRIRLIGGFGAIHWLDAEQLPLANPLARDEAGILEHMHSDHADAVLSLARTAAGRAVESAQLCGIDADGIDLLGDGVSYRLPFAVPVQDIASARQAIIGMIRAAA